MADVTLTCKGSTIAQMDASGSKTLKTAGKYCEGDIGVSYVKPSGGGSDIPASAFVISGNCSYRFAHGGWDWFINQYGNQITTNNIQSPLYMFWNSRVQSIPFDINFNNASSYNDSYIFQDCLNLKEIGKLVNMYPMNLQGLFQGCRSLRYLPPFENLNLDKIHTSSTNCSSMFRECYSLRSIPEDLLKQIYQPKVTLYFYSAFSYEFSSCYTLDEVKGLNPQIGTITSNLFLGMFTYCNRLKNIIFAQQEDGTPYSVNWKNQIIALDYNVGYATDKTNILNYNSGITADKEVTDATTYAALKANPDWFTCDIAYSRYNHDSAVATINSLPDTSAYLATAGGTNTIKFTGAAGSATDGGAINTLTEEEIAIATAKGWTCSLV